MTAVFTITAEDKIMKTFSACSYCWYQFFIMLIFHFSEINHWLMLITITCLSQPFYTNLKMSNLTGWIPTINVSCDDKKVSSWIQIEFVIENFYKCFHIFYFRIFSFEFSGNGSHCRTELSESVTPPAPAPCLCYSGEFCDNL